MDIPCFSGMNMPKRTYHCQRCQNHGKVAQRRDHKISCPFKECACAPCRMVAERSRINSEIKEAAEEIDVVDRASPDIPDDPQPKRKGERNPCCQRCKNHNVKHQLKNHKRMCAFKDCTCNKCTLVQDRRCLMREQIKLRRQQQRERELERRREDEARHNAAVYGLLVETEARRAEMRRAELQHFELLATLAMSTGRFVSPASAAPYGFQSWGVGQSPLCFHHHPQPLIGQPAPSLQAAHTCHSCVLLNNPLAALHLQATRPPGPHL